MQGYQMNSSSSMTSQPSPNIPQIVWVFQLNDTTFCPFSANDMHKLEEAHRRNESSCSVVLGNNSSYTVDLTSMCLVDPNLKKDKKDKKDKKEKKDKDKKNKSKGRFVCRVDLG